MAVETVVTAWKTTRFQWIGVLPFIILLSGFSRYWTFWPICVLVAAALVCIVEFGLTRLYPLDRTS